MNDKIGCTFTVEVQYFSSKETDAAYTETTQLTHSAQHFKENLPVFYRARMCKTNTNRCCHPGCKEFIMK